jgi:hypothetical protein
MRIGTPKVVKRLFTLIRLGFGNLRAERSIFGAHVREGRTQWSAPEANWSLSDANESLELQILGGTLRFGSAMELSNYIEGTSPKTPNGRVHMLPRSKRQINDAAKLAAASFEGQQKGGTLEPATERLNDILVAGATAITDINNLINELQAASDYLQAEAERVRLANAQYAHLAQTASASAKSIAESIGRWRNPQRLSSPPSSNPSNDASHIVQNED